MAPTRIEPDLEFIKELQAVGGESLKKCYQCATCSVACPISPSNNPYPRKEMIWAQWGLKDRLMQDVDIWLCHNCGTCSDLCPRGAKPGDLLAALRNMAYKRLTGPSFLGQWMSAAKYLPLLIGIPALLFLVIWFIRARQLGTAFPTTKEGQIVYGLLFPGDYTIDPIFMLVTLFVVLVFFSGVKKLISSFAPEGDILYLGKRKSIVQCFIEVIMELIAHRKFQDCGVDKAPRKIGHQVLFFGFIFLAIVTGVVATGHWGGEWLGAQLGIKVLQDFGHMFHTPMPQANLIKILANVGAICLVVGLAFLTARRLGQDDKRTVSSFYDWYLLVVIWAVALTGIGSELFRLAGVKYLAYPTYYLHLVSVFMLFAYLPWSKLGHLVYRTSALTYARYIGRKTM